jgi:hypothetical protein
MPGIVSVEGIGRAPQRRPYEEESMSRMIDWTALSEYIRQRALAAEDVDYSTVLDVLEWISDAPMVETGARVLAWEELVGFDGAVLVEYNPDKLVLGPEWMFVDYVTVYDRNQTAYLYRQRGEMKSYKQSGYGVTWRAWTARPTDEKMEAEAWTE